MSHFDFDDCVIYEFDKEKKLLTQIAATGPKKSGSEIKNAKILELGQGIAGSVAKSKKAEIVNDVLQDERCIKDLEDNNSEIAVPILLNGELLGVLDSEHKDKGFYTELHLQNLETVAGVIATKFKASQESEESRKNALQLKQITNNIDAAVFRYVLKSSGEGALTYLSSKTFDIYEVTPEEGLKNDDLIWNQMEPLPMLIMAISYLIPLVKILLKIKKPNLSLLKAKKSLKP
jgi:putative methionine-R-sulfoxide reductase with GAF domain